MRRPEYLYLHEMRDAVVRIIDIVGLPQEFRDRHADIAWRRPIGLRNRIVTASGPLTWRFWL